MTWKPSPRTAIIVAGLAALAGCAPPNGGPGNRGAGTDRGPLDDTEKADITLLRNAAFTSADATFSPSAAPLIEDPHTWPTIGNKSRLSYSAIKHSGYLASLPTHSTTDLENGAVYGPDLQNIMLWGFLSDCPFAPLRPRWAMNNIEKTFTIPSATDTMNPPQTDTPPMPTGKPANPLNRYIINNWLIPPVGPDPDNGDPLQPINADGTLGATQPGWDVHEYELRQPFVPDDFGSRAVSAWLNRDGRIGMIRNQHDLFGFGSISEARTFDFRVLFEGEGKYLPDGLPITSPSDFIGTFIYRINPTRPQFRPSFWPGARQDVTGNRPITFGWSYDPETGARVGPAIHCAGVVPWCSVSFEIRYDPYADAAKDLFQPQLDPTTGAITATSRDDYDDTNATPQVFIDDDPAKPLYPINYKVYTPSCAQVATSLNPNTTMIPLTPTDHNIIESMLLPTEVIIVPQLDKPWIANGLPPGTYRINIIMTMPGGPCPPQVPTEDTAGQNRYFHVWNGSSPNFFRP